MSVTKSTSSRSKRPAVHARRKRRRTTGTEESLNSLRAIDLYRLADQDFGAEKLDCLLAFDRDALASIPQF